MDKTLEKVEAFARKAHEGQWRKFSPEPYIIHPIRVMKICRDYCDELPVLAAALLHDVLEDCEVSKHDMQQFLKSVMNEYDAEKTLQLVIELTDVYVKKDYPFLNRRKRKAKETERLVKTSRISQTIKYADIIDNARELPENGDDEDFAYLFLSECKKLLTKLNKGDAGLYKLAVEVVNDGLKNLDRVQRNG